AQRTLRRPNVVRGLGGTSHFSSCPHATFARPRLGEKLGSSLLRLARRILLSDPNHYRTANGELYGRPNGTPPVTVCTGFRYAWPCRALFLVSTNDTGPSTSSRIAASAGAPICRVPSLGMRLITLAGLVVAMVTT